MTVEQDKPETNRSRVRRLLIEPLTERGFRFRAGTPVADQRKRLDDLADELGYLSDAALIDLEICLRVKGEGSAKCFWPALATFDAYAQVREPRPLGELPQLLRWFASEAGRQALEGDRLVAEYLFWQKFRHPPVKPHDQKAVAEKASNFARRVGIIRERQARGVPVDLDDLGFLRWHDELLARVTGYLGDARAVAA